MARCNSCGGVYYFLFDAKNKEVAVDEKSMTRYEYSGIIRKMKIPYDPSRHKLHMLTCKRNIKIDKKAAQKKNTITKLKGKKTNGCSKDNLFGDNQLK